MRLLVCGGRKFADRECLFKVLDAMSCDWDDEEAKNGITAVIHGNATGADKMAGEWARQNGIEVVVFQAEWHRWGAAAGTIRNQKMLDDGRPDFVVAFPGGNGTADMIRRARLAKIHVFEV